MTSLTKYYHIDSQRGRVPTQVQAKGLDSGGSVGEAGPAERRCDVARAQYNYLV